MALTGSPQVLAEGAHTAVKFRQFMRSLLNGQAGVDGPNSCIVTQRATPGQGVLVGVGGLWMTGTSASTQAVYYDYNDAATDVPAPGAPVTHSRIDRLIYRIYDQDYVGGTDILGDFEWVTGTEATSPVAPSIPVDSMKLYQCLRTVANGNTIHTTDLTDERAFAGNWAPPEKTYWNVLDFGAVGDGVTDDSTAINAAIAQAAVRGGRVRLPVPATGTAYLVASTINLKNNVVLEGDGPNSGNFSNQGSVIDAGSNAIDVITFPSDNTVSTSGMGLYNLQINHGTNGIKSLNFASEVKIVNCEFQNQTNAGIYIEGGVEEWLLDMVKMTGQQYGWRHVNNHVSGSANTKAYIDKCSFRDVLMTGQTKSGWYIECLTSNEVTWYNPILTNIAQHAFYADCAATSWVFINANCENNGNSGKTTVTTGTIGSGTNTLTVASAGDFANGDPIVVKGAGASADLITTISSGGGTTSLVLAANAGTSVTSVEVTNRGYDDFSFNNTIGTADLLGFYNGETGNGSYIRYAIRGDKVNSVSLFNHSCARPAYVLDQLTALGGEPAIRQVNSIAGSTLRSTMFPGPHTASEMPWAMLVSPPGQPLIFASRDSTDNGSGTYSFVEFRERSFSSFRYAYFDPAAWGFVQEYSNGYAQFNGKVNFANQLLPSTPAHANQTACSLYAGTGAPNNSNGNNGDIYFRSDGGSGTTIYQKRSGSWVATGA